MIPTPPTFVAMTHNLWGDKYAAERARALTRLYEVRPPDLLAAQELRGWSRDVVDGTLDGHARVVDDFPGWETQSNLWWRTSLFDYLEHGAEDVGIMDEDARLFWVRLSVVGSPATSLVFATAHLTWPGHALERETGVSPRVSQASAIVAKLASLTPDGRCIVTVDINDIGGANWEFGNGGFLDSFSALHRHSPSTHPVIPSGFGDSIGTELSPLASPSKALDWIFFRGFLRPRASEVVEFFDRSIAPSDHMPVVATFTLTATPAESTEEKTQQKELKHP